MDLFLPLNLRFCKEKKSLITFMHPCYKKSTRLRKNLSLF